LFFTGSDTGVGKTFVTAAVARILRDQGRPVGVCKPVSTGAVCVDGRLRCEDTISLAQAAGMGEDELGRVTPWQFTAPAAPAVAARQAGVKLKLADLIDAVTSQCQPGGALLVEGVGGLLCPLTDQETVADLAVALRFPLVVVVRRSLGTLNHALLTLEAARTRRLRVAGVVVNETEPARGWATATNVDELARRLTVPLLAVVPHSPAGLERVQQAVGRVDWWQMCFSNL
jgi:dethiobiotin synthetase